MKTKLILVLAVCFVLALGSLTYAKDIIKESNLDGVNRVYNNGSVKTTVGTYARVTFSGNPTAINFDDATILDGGSKTGYFSFLVDANCPLMGQFAGGCFGPKEWTTDYKYLDNTSLRSWYSNDQYNQQYISQIPNIVNGTAAHEAEFSYTVTIPAGAHPQKGTYTEEVQLIVYEM